MSLREGRAAALLPAVGALIGDLRALELRVAAACAAEDELTERVENRQDRK